MKKLVYLLIAIVSIACSNKEKKASDGGWDVTVSGTVKFPQEGGKVQIEELTPNDSKKTDSLTVNSDGSYSKEIHITEPGIYRFNFYNVQMVDVVLDKENLTINVDGNDANGSFEIIGSPDFDLIKDVQTKLQAFQQTPEVRKIEGEFQQAVQAKDEARIGKLQDQYMELHYTAYDSIVKSLESKPVTIGLMNLLEGNAFERDRYYPLYRKVANEAKTKWPNSVHTKIFSDLVDKMAVTAIGQKAPEISLPDPSGKTVTLSSFKGKYVLVDFWAFWCKPCRKENPNVVKAYKQFKDKGFEVLGVSLDRDKNDWMSAIKEDGLTWTQVSDLKYFESQAAMDYNITAIPFSILLDPDGVIIAKNLRGAALEKKLNEVFNKKS